MKNISELTFEELLAENVKANKACVQWDGPDSEGASYGFLSDHARALHIEIIHRKNRLINTLQLAISHIKKESNCNDGMVIFQADATLKIFK